MFNYLFSMCTDTVHAVLYPVGFIMLRQLKIVGTIRILPH